MKIVCCNEVPMEDIYGAFSKGFSDYMIQFEMEQEQFESHFFGPEGNKLLFSFIAYEDDQPVGLVLGGCKTYEGLLTLRCGTMCVIPEFRGQGIARKLLNAHQKLASDLGCKQLFLECIKGNDKAHDFYLTSGYKIVHQLKYYGQKKYKQVESDVVEASFLDYKQYRDQVEGHVNWQNEIWYLEQLEPKFKMIKIENKVIGMVGYIGARMCYLHVKKAFRLNGFAKQLVYSLEEKQVKISFPSQGGLEGFLTHVGFEEDTISQVEMYKTI